MVSVNNARVEGVSNGVSESGSSWCDRGCVCVCVGGDDCERVCERVLCESMCESMCESICEIICESTCECG